MNAPNGNPHIERRYMGMKKPLAFSVLLHGVIVLALIVGFPYLRPERKIPEMISVELATVADLTQAEKPPMKSPEKPEKEEPPQKKEQKTPPKAAPSVAQKPVKEPPKKPEKKPQEIKEVKTPKEDELALPKKPEKKPEKKPKKEEAQDNPEKFSSLLKNLTKEEAEKQPDIAEVTEKVTKATPSPDTPHTAEKMTMNEIDALRKQWVPCWNVNAGAAEAQDLAVELRVIFNPDGTVQKATIFDESRYNRDDFFRVAADRALWAVNDPRCSPIKLPADRYEVWRDIIVNFDPKEMF